MTRKRQRFRKAFTMVEILVVVIIIGVLAALIAPRFLGKVAQARAAVAKQQVEEIGKAVDRFALEYERYPTSLDELVVRPSDIPEDRPFSPSIRKKDLTDPWGHPFVYKYPGDHTDVPYDLYCQGADGQDGGEGDNADITNW